METTEKRKWARGDALEVAAELCDELRGATLRLTVAGSVRRMKPMVGDVELLFVPRLEERAKDLLDTHEVDTAVEAIEQMLAAGVITQRPSKAGRFAWGVKNKLAIHVASGIPVDFFSEPSEFDWWRSLVIRTGPSDFNIRAITTAAKRGIVVHAYGHGLNDKFGNIIPCSSEREFLEICGIGWVEPEDRK